MCLKLSKVSLFGGLQHHPHSTDDECQHWSLLDLMCVYVHMMIFSRASKDQTHQFGQECSHFSCVCVFFSIYLSCTNKFPLMF